jgi:GAF domain-containing protein
MPADEQARLDALHDFGVLDGASERRFDDIAALASTSLDMPIAMISLVAEDRQWAMASVGIERGELPREHAFCHHAILQDEPMVIEDTRADGRFADNPLVTGSSALRFYAAAPLIAAGGFRLGTVCVLDRKPRTLAPHGLEILTLLARQVVDLFELRLAATRLDGALQRLQTMATLIPICSHCRKVRDESNHWSTLERLVQAKTGSRFTHGICPECVREHYPDAAEELLRRS